MKCPVLYSILYILAKLLIFRRASLFPDVQTVVTYSSNKSLSVCQNQPEPASIKHTDAHSLTGARTHALSSKVGGGGRNRNYFRNLTQCGGRGRRAGPWNS